MTENETEQPVPTPSPDNPFYRVGTIARMLDVNPTHVRGWVTTGELRGYKIEGQWRVLKSDLTEFINKTYGDNS